MEKIDLMYSSRQAALIKDAVLQSMENILCHGQFIQGKEVTEFENLAAKYTGSKFAIGCANGTDALTVALMAIDLKPGDVVFTPSFTYIATAEAISILHGAPYFVDINPDTYNISLTSLEHAIQDAQSKGLNTKAILSVDLFGNPVDYDGIRDIADKYGLSFISDAAQSFGAKYQGKTIGALADITTTSFFPTKPLGCYGDGGMIFTDNEDLAMRMRSICFHGKGESKYHHVRIGMNSRLDSIQAAVLLAKMKLFDTELESRNTLATQYTDNLKDIAKTPTIAKNSYSSWAVYTLMHKDRDQIIQSLAAHPIPSNVYYRTPLHLQPAYQHCYRSEDLSHSERASQEAFCLPMHGYIDPEQANFISDTAFQIISSLGAK